MRHRDEVQGSRLPGGWLRSSPLRGRAAWAGVVVLALLVTPREPFSWNARIATGLVGVAIVAVALARNQHRRRPEDVPRPQLGGSRTASLVVWLVVLGGLVAYQLAIFFSEPRDLYPTLSSLINPVIEPYLVRAAAFFTWIWAGWYLVARR
jgi:hypothetical protein